MMESATSAIVEGGGIADKVLFRGEKTFWRIQSKICLTFTLKSQIIEKSFIQEPYIEIIARDWEKNIEAPHIYISEEKLHALVLMLSLKEIKENDKNNNNKDAKLLRYSGQASNKAIQIDRIIKFIFDRIYILISTEKDLKIELKKVVGDPIEIEINEPIHNLIVHKKSVPLIEFENTVNAFQEKKNELNSTYQIARKHSIAW